MTVVNDILASHPVVIASFAYASYKVVAEVWKIAIATFKQFLRPGKKLTKYGTYAVITGATDGIGKAYAFQLAKQGMSLVLISRTEAKLKAVKEEIDAKKYSGVDVKYVVCDYSKFNDAAKATIQKELSNLSIGVLINNVGVSYRYPMYFHELSNDEVTALIEMNVHSTTWMTRYVLPGMLERKKGAIVNISSGSAMYPLPLLGEYSAAKSFVEKFTLALNAEYASKGISVQCQIPFYVSTKLAKMRQAFSVPTPEAFAKLGVKWIGQSEPVVSPYWVHAMMGCVLDRLPTFVVTKVIMNMHLATRKRGLKKDAAKKAE